MSAWRGLRERPLVKRLKVMRECDIDRSRYETTNIV
jgi:hypothetical protein